MRNAAKRRFWDHTMWGGGGGVVANREPGSYMAMYLMVFLTIFRPTHPWIGPQERDVGTFPNRIEDCCHRGASA